VLAQMDQVKKTFNVTFEKRQTNPEEILKAVKSVSKNAKLVGIAAADGKSGLGWGGCAREELGRGEEVARSAPGWAIR